MKISYPHFSYVVAALLSSNMLYAGDEQKGVKVDSQKAQNVNVQKSVDQKAIEWDYLNDITNYNAEVESQKVRVKNSTNLLFSNQALKLLDEGFLLKNISLSQEIIELDISEFRTLFLTTKKLLLSIQKSLISKSEEQETVWKNSIYDKIISLLLKKVDKILAEKNLSPEGDVKALYDALIVDLDKIVKRITNKNHPVLLVCENLKYFLEFAIANKDANSYLVQNEKSIQEYYEKEVRLYASAGVEKSLDGANIVKVGANVKTSQSVEKTDRGAAQNTTLGAGLSAIGNLKIANIKGVLGASAKSGVSTTGLNASQLLKDNLADKTKKVMLQIPEEYTVFSDKRSKIIEMSKQLGHYTTNFGKLFKRYAGVPYAKIICSFIDPKYNLEKEKSVEISSSVKVSANVLSSILNCKIKTDAEFIRYTKNNNIYNFIRERDFSLLLGDFGFFKRVAITCDKYSHIKAAYDKEGRCDSEKLLQRFTRYVTKHGDFKSAIDFINTIEYYAEILQSMSNAQDKKALNQLQKAKKQIEKMFKTNGRLNTLITGYFMGIGYLVMDSKEKITKENMDRMKSAFERIALLMGESKSSSNKKKEQTKTCTASQNRLSVSLADKFLNFEICATDGSPYIFDNGLEINIDIDVTKIDKLFNSLRSLLRAYNKGKTAIESFDSMQKLTYCLNKIEYALLKYKEKIISKIKNNFGESSYDIFEQMCATLKNIKDGIDHNGESLAVKSHPMRIIDTFVSSKNETIRFVFKSVSTQAGSKIEFLGLKALSSVRTNFGLSTSTFTEELPVDANVKFGIERSRDSGFIEMNGESMYLPLKDIVDYCFIKEADFGKLVSSKNIKDEFITDNLSEKYVQKLMDNMKNGVFLQQLKDDLVSISYYDKFYKTKEGDQIRRLEAYMNDPKSITSPDKMLDLLSIYGRLLFVCIAKPYNKAVYDK